MQISFVIPGEPKGKQRPRFSRAGAFVSTYTPTETVNYENLVKLEYQDASKGLMLSDKAPLEMKIDAFYSIPKSTSKKQHDLMVAGLIQPTKKPDCDNIIKIVCDALNGIAYRDDAQVVNVTCTKYYSDKPRVNVSIKSIERG